MYNNINSNDARNSYASNMTLASSLPSSQPAQLAPWSPRAALQPPQPPHKMARQTKMGYSCVTVFALFIGIFVFSLVNSAVASSAPPTATPVVRQIVNRMPLATPSPTPTKPSTPTPKPIQKPTQPPIPTKPPVHTGVNHTPWDITSTWDR